MRPIADPDRFIRTVQGLWTEFLESLESSKPRLDLLDVLEAHFFDVLEQHERKPSSALFDCGMKALEAVLGCLDSMQREKDPTDREFFQEAAVKLYNATRRQFGAADRECKELPNMRTFELRREVGLRDSMFLVEWGPNGLRRTAWRRQQRDQERHVPMEDENVPEIPYADADEPFTAKLGELPPLPQFVIRLSFGVPCSDEIFVFDSRAVRATASCCGFTAKEIMTRLVHYRIDERLPAPTFTANQIARLLNLPKESVIRARQEGLEALRKLLARRFRPVGRKRRVS